MRAWHRPRGLLSLPPAAARAFLFKTENTKRDRYGYYSFDIFYFTATVGGFFTGGYWLAVLDQYSTNAVRVYPWDYSRGLDYCPALSLSLCAACDGVVTKASA